MNARKWSARFGLMLTAACVAGYSAHAAAPLAGEVIGNQAAATYVNASGDTVSVTSNEVQTVVQQVAGLTLVTDTSETVAPGGKVFLPHVVTNDGNGTDIFDLSAVDANLGGGGYDFVNVTIYPDADLDGVADGTTPISATPVLDAGEKFGIVIEATVPSGAAASSAEDVTVLAVSQFNDNVNATNTDTVTVSTGPVTEIVKRMTVADGPGAAADGIVGPGDIVTIRLTYSSTGLAAATDLVVTDQLDQYLDYTGSAIWSDSASALSDADDSYELTNGSGQQIDYQYDGTDTVTFQIDSVPSGRTGNVTFTATIAADAPAGDIDNIATQTVNGVAFPPSNEATITVEEVYAATAADARSTAYQADPDNAVNLIAAPASSTDDDGALNDIVEEDADVYQGGSMTFEFVVTNQSNVTDSIDVSVLNSSFPAGTTLQLVGSDGATPVVGALGPLASGAATTVNVIATLPANAAAAAAGTTNYEAVLSAQSVNGGPVNSSTARFTGAVLGATVDLENTNGTGDGPNPLNGSGEPWIDYTTNPGAPVTYVLNVQNDGPTADTYDLTLDTPLPTGWTATFLLPDGTPVTNTGSIPGGSQLPITVVITPPAGSPPVDQPVTVAVLSPTSGQGDTLTNAIVVNEIVDLSLTADQTVQVAPGGIADIPHVLENQGNIAITEGAISLAGDMSSFTGTVFWDVNGDNTVDAGDVVVDNINDIGSIAPGASIPLLFRVQVPSTGAVGLSETETITVATALNNGADTDSDTGDNAVTDTVIIVSGDMTLNKVQAIDPLCDGNPGSFVSSSLQAEPGQCIRYRITANNTGTQDAGSVTIRDITPGFTTLTECGGGCDVTVTPGGSSVTSQPGEGAGGALESSHGTLIPGQPATLSFTVKIDE